MEDLNNRKVREVIVDTTPHPVFIVNSKCLSIGQAVVEFADNSYQVIFIFISSRQLFHNY